MHPFCKIVLWPSFDGLFPCQDTATHEWHCVVSCYTSIHECHCLCYFSWVTWCGPSLTQNILYSRIEVPLWVEKVGLIFMPKSTYNEASLVSASHVYEGLLVCYIIFVLCMRNLRYPYLFTWRMYIWCNMWWRARKYFGRRGKFIQG